MSALVIFIIVALTIIFSLVCAFVFFYIRLSKQKDTGDSDLLINFTPENDSIKTGDEFNPDEEMLITNNLISLDKNSGLVTIGLITGEEVGKDSRRRIKYMPRFKNVKINLPYLSEDLNDKIKKTYCGKCFMSHIEKRDTMRDILGIKNEHLDRVKLIAKAAAGGELSKEELKRLSELIAVLNEEIVKQNKGEKFGQK